MKKTLAYEQLKAQYLGWPYKMLLASGNFDQCWRFVIPTTKPGVDVMRYRHDATQSRTLLRSERTDCPTNFTLTSRVTENLGKILPFKVNPSSSVQGWYYAKSGTDPTPSVTVVPREASLLPPSGSLCMAYLRTAPRKATNSMLSDKTIR